MELEDIVGFLEENNFKITAKRILGFVAMVTGERNA